MESERRYVLREVFPDDDSEDDYEVDALTEEGMAEMLAGRLGMKLVPL